MKFPKSTGTRDCYYSPIPRYSGGEGRVRGQRTSVVTVFTFFENNSSINPNVRIMKPYLPLTLTLSPEYRGEGNEVFCLFVFLAC